MELFLPLLVVFAGLLFLASRRQKREAKALQDMQAALAVGDVVMTTSGLHGTVTDLDEDTADLEIAPGVITTWNRLAVRQLVEDATSAAAEPEAAQQLQTPEEQPSAPRLTKD